MKMLPSKRVLAVVYFNNDTESSARVPAILDLEEIPEGLHVTAIVRAEDLPGQPDDLEHDLRVAADELIENIVLFDVTVAAKI